MKTTKKILAALLVVMMLAMMIPFSASAETTTETSYSYEITGKKGYTFTAYKVADVDTTSGEYSNFASDDVKAALTTATPSGVDTAELLTACNALSADTLATLSKQAIAFTDNSTKTIEPGAGVYYIKVTGTPAGTDVKSVQNSVFSLPYYTGNGWVNTVSFNAGNKITDGTPTVVKSFTDDDKANKTSITEFIGKDVNFTLTGSVVGSTTEKATAYTFVDTMSEGLEFKSITSVTLTGGNAADKTLLESEYTYKAGTTNNDFTVELASSVLADDAFYSYSNVVVKYVATLDTDAVIGGNGNPNEVDLKYTDSYGVESTIEGNELKVYTYKLEVLKVDGNNSQPLQGAGFTLYTDSACKNVATNGDEATTDENGKATFTGLAAGTYYLKETKAPAGYNLNSTVFTITVAEDGSGSTEGVYSQTVNDYPLETPNTGGMGTMMFTIGGALLIACAGVLFLVVRRKKNA